MNNKAQSQETFAQRSAKKEHFARLGSIAVTAEEHQIFTNAWRSEIGYKGGSAIINTVNATKEQIHGAATRIYANYPQILKALGL